MKKLTAMILLITMALLCGCGKDTFTISITVPAGSQGEFVFADEEICPTGKKIRVSCGEGLGETEVLLVPVDETVTAGYVNTPIAPGAPAAFDADPGAWLKVGVNAANDTAEDVTVWVKVTGVEVRIE